MASPSHKIRITRWCDHYSINILFLCRTGIGHWKWNWEPDKTTTAVQFEIFVLKTLSAWETKNSVKIDRRLLKIYHFCFSWETLFRLPPCAVDRTPLFLVRQKRFLGKKIVAPWLLAGKVSDSLPAWENKTDLFTQQLVDYSWTQRKLAVLNSSIFHIGHLFPDDFILIRWRDGGFRAFVAADDTRYHCVTSPSALDFDGSTEAMRVVTPDYTS